MDSLKLAALLAVGVAADSYLDAYALSNPNSPLPPGVVYSEPQKTEIYHQPQPAQPVYHNYLPVPPATPALDMRQQFDPARLIQLGFSLATMLKIILKVLIFKFLIKFLAIMCVLLFLPYIQKDEMMTTTTTTTTTPEPEKTKQYTFWKVVTTEMPPYIYGYDHDDDSNHDDYHDDDGDDIDCSDDEWPCYTQQNYYDKLGHRITNRKKGGSSRKKPSQKPSLHKKKTTVVTTTTAPENNNKKNRK